MVVHRAVMLIAQLWLLLICLPEAYMNVLDLVTMLPTLMNLERNQSVTVWIEA